MPGGVHPSFLGPLEGVGRTIFLGFRILFHWLEVGSLCSLFNCLVSNLEIIFGGGIMYKSKCYYLLKLLILCIMIFLFSNRQVFPSCIFMMHVFQGFLAYKIVEIL